jgi:hypothetical protein
MIRVCASDCPLSSDARIQGPLNSEAAATCSGFCSRVLVDLHRTKLAIRVANEGETITERYHPVVLRKLCSRPIRSSLLGDEDAGSWLSRPGLP